jgi:long-chain-fatty-acid---luciferin-component ligase
MSRAGLREGLGNGDAISGAIRSIGAPAEPASLGRFSLLESVLYGEESLYDWPVSRIRDFQVAVVRDAFALHYAGCESYRRFCDRAGFRPASLCSADDLPRVPLIPSLLFKDMDIRSVPGDELDKICKSSGTRGIVSQVSRNTVTLERFLGSIRIGADQLLQLANEARFFNLGPDTAEAGDIWFSYVMSLLSLLRPSDNYVVDGVFRSEELIRDLDGLPPGIQPLLVGPPILFLDLMEDLEREGRLLDLGARHGRIVTAGGWKRFSSEQIERGEFLDRCVRDFGIERAGVRDAFNMVELNTVLLECEHGSKHAPPWLVLLCLDPESLEPVLPGQRGLLGFLDPLPESYPGFVLSDDFVRMGAAPCPCGRTGATFEFDRRVHLADERGCALTIERKTHAHRATRGRRT